MILYCRKIQAPQPTFWSAESNLLQGLQWSNDHDIPLYQHPVTHDTQFTNQSIRKAREIAHLLSIIALPVRLQADGHVCLSCLRDWSDVSKQRVWWLPGANQLLPYRNCACANKSTIYV
ncbi:hypothetical protein FKM82_020820 [Ascaphus truei]